MPNDFFLLSFSDSAYSLCEHDFGPYTGMLINP